MEISFGFHVYVKSLICLFPFHWGWLESQNWQATLYQFDYFKEEFIYLDMDGSRLIPNKQLFSFFSSTYTWKHAAFTETKLL